MKKWVAMLLAVLVVFSLAACGETEEDPNAGIYQGVCGTLCGVSMPVDQLFEGGCSIELKTGGKGIVAMNEETYKIKWEAEGETLTISLQGEESIGTLKDGIIDIEFLGMGLVLTFEKTEAAS